MAVSASSRPSEVPDVISTRSGDDGDPAAGEVSRDRLAGLGDAADAV